jgi:DNA-binding protein HU-beta
LKELGMRLEWRPLHEALSTAPRVSARLWLCGKPEVMNKSQLVEEIASRTKLPAADVAAVVDSLIAIVTRTVVRGEKVVLSGFGTFQRRARARRTARDIWADKPLKVPATNVPSFKPGRPFREAVARRRRRPT